MRVLLSRWYQWAAEKRKKRNVRQAKVQSIQHICGKHLNSPQLSQDEHNDDDDENKEEEVEEETETQSLLTRFKCIVNEVIENTRKEKIVLEMIEKQKERENCTFQFLSDDESVLYR